MAQPQQQQQDPNGDDDMRLAFFPPPPPFYHHFTTENQDRLKEVKKDAGIDAAANNNTAAKLTAEQLLALPTELRYLIPPEPPKDDEEFKVFGNVTKLQGGESFTKTMEWISRTLAADFTLVDWKYEQLYPSTSTSTSSSASSTLDRQRYLFRFLRSILIAYIELLGIVAINPTSEQKDQKLQDILTLVTNMHALINEYRPHQARETLIREMERQVERKRGEVEGVTKMKARVMEVLEGFGKEVGEGEEGTGGEVEVGVAASEEDSKRDVQWQMWEGVYEILAQ